MDKKFVVLIWDRRDEKGNFVNPTLMTNQIGINLFRCVDLSTDETEMIKELQLQERYGDNFKILFM